MDTGQWVVIQGSVTGPNHIREGVTNQDATAAVRLRSGAYLLAVADGAGSRSRSDQGARFAMDIAKVTAGEWFDRRLPANSTEWRSALRTYADRCLARFDSRVDRQVQEIRAEEHDTRSDADIRGDFATTMFAVIMAPPYLAYFAIGDGFLVVSRQPGGSNLLHAPAASRDNVFETTFLTSREREANLDWQVLPDDRIRGVCLGTDGVIEAMLSLEVNAHGETAYGSPADFEQYFDYFAKPDTDPGDLERQLQSTKFAGTSGDDKSMIIAVRP